MIYKIISKLLWLKVAISNLILDTKFTFVVKHLIINKITSLRFFHDF